MWPFTGNHSGPSPRLPPSPYIGTFVTDGDHGALVTTPVDVNDSDLPFRYAISSYGADYPVDGLVKRLKDNNRPRMYNTTGFTRDEIAELCTRIEARKLAPGTRRWPPILGLHNALTATLTYMRRNRVQAEIAETYGVSQPTISRAISAITPLLMNVLLDFVPTADDLDSTTCYIVDGTLLPCWSWALTRSCTPGSTRPPE